MGAAAAAVFENDCWRRSLLKISFSDPGASDQKEPRPSLAGLGTFTKAYKYKTNVGSE